MAIVATYKHGNRELKKHYFRIDRIWGSKAEGWNAFVGVYAKAKDEEAKETFHVACQYENDANPYPLLYAAVEKMDFVKDAQHDTKSGPEPVFEDVTLETKEKKVRAKKNTAQ